MNTAKEVLSCTVSDGELIACISGDIDHHSSKLLRTELDAKIAEAPPDALTIDLSGVSFMDSSGLGLILGRYSRAAASGIAFRVIGADKRVMRIFEMAGMTKLINIERGL